MEAFLVCCSLDPRGCGEDKPHTFPNKRRGLPEPPVLLFMHSGLTAQYPREAGTVGPCPESGVHPIPALLGILERVLICQWLPLVSALAETELASQVLRHPELSLHTSSHLQTSMLQLGSHSDRAAAVAGVPPLGPFLTESGQHLCAGKTKRAKCPARCPAHLGLPAAPPDFCPFSPALSPIVRIEASQIQHLEA
jgi:hypothetical protein